MNGMYTPPVDGPNLVEIAAHTDRMRRQQVARQPDRAVRELHGGWLSGRPGGDGSEFPSMSLDRVFWLTLARKLEAADIDAARRAACELDLPRIFVWLAPWAWDDQVERMLNDAGARPQPHIRYLTLAREARAFAPARPSSLTVRHLTSADAGPVLTQTFGWYASPDTLRSVELGHAEFCAAFDGDRPVAVAQLKIDGEFAYLGGAMTHPDFRNRGAQSALIAARVARTESAGARWCISETNTAATISLNNLVRCGFGAAVEWRVYAWKLVGAVAGPIA